MRRERLELKTFRSRTAAVVALVGGVAMAAGLVVPSSAAPGQGDTASYDAPFQDGQLLVAFRKGTSDADKKRALDGVHGHQKKAIGAVVLAEVPRGHVKDSVAQLRSDKHVRFAEPDWIGQLAATPNDPSFGQQWALANTGQTVGGVTGTAGEDIDAKRAWDVTTGSSSVVVGVVDTGADLTHPDLAANLWNNPGGIGGCGAGTHGYNVLTGSCTPADDDTAYGGHGSHVAGIIGAVGNNGTGVSGIGWRTKVLPVKTVDSSGNGTTSALISGLD